ncbi:MAG: hypothetical protein HY554_09945 [Elusimicrobia bacterium]|nr:hypothetical protein [Elusimicrobiota bacterium]
MSGGSQAAERPGVPLFATPLRVALPWIMGAAAALLYLSAPGAAFNHDGVACAIAIEGGSTKFLAHSQHLAYGVIGRALYLLLGRGVPAIACLQILCSLLGAAGVAGTCALLLRFGLAPGLAAAAGAGVMVSEVYWAWSLEAQVFPLGAAFLVWTAVELAGSRRPLALGLLHAGAVLGHVAQLTFLPAVWLLLPEPAARRRYLKVLASTVGACYLLAFFLLVKPSSLGRAWAWALGSAGLNPGIAFEWHGGLSVKGLLEWLALSLRLLGPLPAGLLAVGLAAFGVAAGWRRRSGPVPLLLLWLAGHAAIFITWEPSTAPYRYPDVMALWALAACGVAELGKRWRVPGRVQAAAAGLSVLALGVHNWTRSIRPATDPSNNAALQRVLWVSRETREQGWVVAAGIDQVYLAYFGNRSTINLHFQQDPGWLKDRVRAIQAHREPVYGVPEALPPWAGATLLELGAKEISSHRGQRLLAL